MSDAAESKRIVQALAGDELAIHRLLMLHHEAIAAVLRKRIPADLSSVLSAEDVCQDAYAAAVAELGAFQSQGPTSFHNWLLTIAERKLIDAIRAHRAVKRGGGRRAVNLPLTDNASSMVTILEQVAIHERTPSRSVADHELASAVQAGLDRLKEDYRTALRCRYFEGLTAAETGARMGRSEGAVLKLCERGLRHLADQIGDASRFFSRKP